MEVAPDQKRAILDFVRKHKISVLSTVTPDNKSESAVVTFAETDDLEVVFETVSDYRKYKNLQHNQSVSMVIGWDEKITVQYDGEAKEIFGEEQAKYKKIYFQKHPELQQKWEAWPGMVFFRVTPKWIRYSDLNKKPWEIFEVGF